MTTGYVIDASDIEFIKQALQRLIHIDEAVAGDRTRYTNHLRGILVRLHAQPIVLTPSPQELTQQACAHVWDKRPKSDSGAQCSACGLVKVGGWFCPQNKATGLCEYNIKDDPCCDVCLHCGQPEERK